LSLIEAPPYNSLNPTAKVRPVYQENSGAGVRLIRMLANGCFGLWIQPAVDNDKL
jgi:hypothetical protein